MSMTAFFTQFPDLAVKETRVATLTGQPGLPDGEYGFLELYCDDPACDCWRVYSDNMSTVLHLYVFVAPPYNRNATTNFASAAAGS